MMPWKRSDTETPQHKKRPKNGNLFKIEFSCFLKSLKSLFLRISHCFRTVSLNPVFTGHIFLRDFSIFLNISQYFLSVSTDVWSVSSYFMKNKYFQFVDHFPVFCYSFPHFFGFIAFFGKNKIFSIC